MALETRVPCCAVMFSSVSGCHANDVPFFFKFRLGQRRRAGEERASKRERERERERERGGRGDLGTAPEQRCRRPSTPAGLPRRASCRSRPPPPPTSAGLPINAPTTPTHIRAIHVLPVLALRFSPSSNPPSRLSLPLPLYIDARTACAHQTTREPLRLTACNITRTRTWCPSTLVHGLHIRLILKLIRSVCSVDRKSVV